MKFLGNIENHLMTNKNRLAVLALESGEVFYGTAIGVDGCSCGEIVFNTAITGYQEVLTDPSYTRQMIVFTYPHIGNVGVNTDDEESMKVWAAGLILREQPSPPSNWRAAGSLNAFLFEQRVVGIAEVDTRYLTQLIQKTGSKNACIMSGKKVNANMAVQLACQYKEAQNVDLVNFVSTTKSCVWSHDAIHRVQGNSDLHILVYDFGVKHSILRKLAEYGCKITVVPVQTSIDKALSFCASGIVLSNGPGDPLACSYVIKIIQDWLKIKIPILGICLGHQLLALANGAHVTKMKLGHHGINHPVKHIQTGKIFITSQNHNFVVSEQDLPSNIIVTHRSLFDQTLQGFELTDTPAIGFQGHPEGSPGPFEVDYIFTRFIDLVRKYKHVRE